MIQPQTLPPVPSLAGLPQFTEGLGVAGPEGADATGFSGLLDAQLAAAIDPATSDPEDLPQLPEAAATTPAPVSALPADGKIMVPDGKILPPIAEVPLMPVTEQVSLHRLVVDERIALAPTGSGATVGAKLPREDGEAGENETSTSQRVAPSIEGLALQPIQWSDLAPVANFPLPTPAIAAPRPEAATAQTDRPAVTQAVGAQAAPLPSLSTTFAGVQQQAVAPGQSLRRVRVAAVAIEPAAQQVPEAFGKPGVNPPPVVAPATSAGAVALAQPVAFTSRQAESIARAAPQFAAPSARETGRELAPPQVSAEPATAALVAALPPASAADVRAAGPAPATTAPQPHDFAQLVDRLVAAREALAPQTVSLALDHADFGKVHVRFASDDAGLSVALASPDPDFARAVNTASLPVAPVDAAAAPTPQRGDSANTNANADSNTHSRADGRSERRDDRPAQRHQTASSDRDQPPARQGRGVLA